jgi:menaquinone-dependent protoporphyrinogen IX oxidase
MMGDSIKGHKFYPIIDSFVKKLKQFIKDKNKALFYLGMKILLTSK